VIAFQARRDIAGEAWADTLAGLAERHRNAHANGDAFRPWAAPPLALPTAVEVARREVLTRLEPPRKLDSRAL
jgi:hypothetical protein